MNRISSGLFSILLLSAFACHQERPEKEPVWETSSKSLEVLGRDVLTFTLPENFQKEEPVISSRPGNAAVAELVKGASGVWVLRYQSLDGKAGLDKLSIDSEASEKEKHHDCGNGNHPKPSFGHHPKPREMKGHFRLLLDIAVKEKSAGTIKSAFGGNNK
jgi:hypothetical protein